MVNEGDLGKDLDVNVVNSILLLNKRTIAIHGDFVSRKITIDETAVIGADVVREAFIFGKPVPYTYGGSVHGIVAENALWWICKDHRNRARVLILARIFSSLG